MNQPPHPSLSEKIKDNSIDKRIGVGVVYRRYMSQRPHPLLSEKNKLEWCRYAKIRWRSVQTLHEPTPIRFRYTIRFYFLEGDAK